MDAKEAFQKLCQVSEKLLHEVERLRGDVKSLDNRIKPDSGWVRPEFPDLSRPRKKINIVDAINEIEAARKGLAGAEMDIQFIKSRLDDIAANEANREEMRKHLKEGS